MTPLPRWVFLALLLGSAVGFKAHPNDDACVRLCRAEKRSSEISGVCNYERLVLQSDGGETPIHRLFRLCLTPCGEPGSPDDRLVFGDSEACRSFRHNSIELLSCSCDSFDESSRFKGWEDSSYMDRLLEHHVEHEGSKEQLEHKFSTMLKNILEARVADEPPEVAPSNSDDSEKMKDENTVATTVDPDSSEEVPVDWEMWCMAMCDHGQGGSACNCDIIP